MIAGRDTPYRAWMDTSAGKIYQYGFVLVPLLFYGLSASPTPVWLDATLILHLSRNLSLNAWVNNHNLFNLLGFGWMKMLFFVDPYQALGLLAALFGSLAVYTTFLIGLEFDKTGIAGTCGALALMVSHAVWWHSTVVEVYTLNAFLIAVMVLGILRYEARGRIRSLYAAAFAWGLGVSNHVLMGLFGVSAIFLLVVVLLRKSETRRGGKALLLVVFFLLGAALYIGVFLRDVFVLFERLKLSTSPPGEAFGEALRQTVHRATGGDFKSYMFTEQMTAGERWRWRFNYLLLFGMNFPSAALPLGIYGFIAWWRRKDHRLSVGFVTLGLIPQIIWSANYFIWDMFAFSMPVYVLFGFSICYGIAEIVKKGKKTNVLLAIALPTLLLPLLLYPWMAHRGQREGAVRRYFSSYAEYHMAKPAFDPIRYIVNPFKGGYSESTVVFDALFAELPEGAYVLAGDPTIDYVLRYYYRGIRHEREDLRLFSLFAPFIDEREAEYVAGRIFSTVRSGDPVSFVSLEHPERMVLNHLVPRIIPGTRVDEVRGRSTEELRELLKTSPYFSSRRIRDDWDMRLYRISLPGETD